jgi:LysM repeat protein
MRLQNRMLAAGVVTLASLGLFRPFPASAASYTVQPNDTLSSIAQQFGTTVDALVQDNSLTNPDYIPVGMVLDVPDNSTACTASDTTYTVQPGDSLTAISQQYNVSIDALAQANSISQADFIQAGQQLTIPGGGCGATAASAVSDASYVDPSTVQAVLVQQANAIGVDPALVEALAWQESGWQMITAADGGMGVMQLMPDTVTWLSQSFFGGYQINPYDLTDNVRAGVTLLAFYLRYFGDESLAIAAYNQGMTGLTSYTVNVDTQQYVADVMALQARFGG